MLVLISIVYLGLLYLLRSLHDLLRACYVGHGLSGLSLFGVLLPLLKVLLPLLIVLDLLALLLHHFVSGVALELEASACLRLLSL